jgi:hypothetical protein
MQIIGHFLGKFGERLFNHPLILVGGVRFGRVSDYGGIRHVRVLLEIVPLRSTQHDGLHKLLVVGYPRRTSSP